MTSGVGVPIPAYISGVRPSRSTSSTLAPAPSRRDTTPGSGLPRAANINGVTPLRSRSRALAPARSADRNWSHVPL